MLVRLQVAKFALIEQIEIDFCAGLNILTGETGAGKSIIIDAMDVVLGGQGTTDYIRTGAERAVIEALFDISETAPVQAKLKEFGLFEEDDGKHLLLTREISRSAKNLCRVNGRVVTLGMYREIGRQLIDIYGQHHQQSLLEKEKHLHLLDSFGGQQVQELLGKTSALYKQYRELADKISGLKSDEQDRIRRLDMLRYQLSEIDNANLAAAEDIKLENERNLLANAEKLAHLCSGVYDALYAGRVGQTAALDGIHEAMANLRELAKIDPQLIALTEITENILYQLEDIAREAGKYRERMEVNPERLEQVNNRLEQIKQLKRKYGTTIEEIIVYREQVAASIDEADRAEEIIDTLNKELSALEQQYGQVAGELSKIRSLTAGQLEQSITGELAALAMPRVAFRAELTRLDAPGSRGMDSVEFMISSNPGEPLKPLAKIVSGGEMSRIMLAMKAILARVDAMPTMIFDEVDAGLGGKAVQAVAEKLALIGRNRQVICVTHAPQIASYADAHYNISKIATGRRTETVVNRLSAAGRAAEIASMLGGNNISDVTRKHAQEMLDKAAENKKCKN